MWLSGAQIGQVCRVLVWAELTNEGGLGCQVLTDCVPFQLKHIPPYGFLYYKQLQSLFRQCGQVKSIVFDGAK